MPINYGLITEDIELKKDMLYKDQIIVSYHINYPQFSSKIPSIFLNRINLYYKSKALEYQDYCEKKLYKMAMEQYQYSEENSYPVMKYEALEKYTITYNNDCTISLYFDQYEYQGGAHGSTVRSSDTWNLQRAKKVHLGTLFPLIKEYKLYLINKIIEQIREQMNAGTSQYFDEYPELVVKYFNENSFYVTDEGVAIYYQEYDIAPYVAGMPVFIIPLGSYQTLC